MTLHLTTFALFLVAAVSASALGKRTEFKENVSFNLTCSQNDTDDAGPTFLWWYGNRQLKTNNGCCFFVHLPVKTAKIRGARLWTSILEVMPLLRHSNTIVKCQIFNYGNTVDRTWTLSIAEWEPPRINPRPPSGAALLEGLVSTFTCISMYDTNITWSLDGRSLGPSALYRSNASGGSTTSAVSFIATRSQHRHLLRCEIPSVNEGATESPANEVVLTVLYPPSIISPGRISNLSNVFSCEVDANPAANFVWVGPDGIEIPAGESQHSAVKLFRLNGTLTRSELTTNPAAAIDGGDYKCIASNAYGNSSALIGLTNRHLALYIGVSIGVFSFGVLFIILVFKLLSWWKPYEVSPPEPIYDTALLEGSFGLTKIMPGQLTSTWKRGTFFGSRHSEADMEMPDRPRLSTTHM